MGTVTPQRDAEPQTTIAEGHASLATGLANVVTALEALAASTDAQTDSDLDVTLGAAAEVADVIAITGTLSRAAVTRLWVGGYQAPAASGALALHADADLTLDVTTGTLVSAAAAAGILLDTDAAGAFALDATDVVGAASVVAVLAVRLGSSTGRLLGLLGVVFDGV